MGRWRRRVRCREKPTHIASLLPAAQRLWRLPGVRKTDGAHRALCRGSELDRLREVLPGLLAG